MLVAGAALFVALGGGSAYAGAILSKNSVGSSQIKPNAIHSSDIHNGSVGVVDLSEAARNKTGPLTNGEDGADGAAGSTGAAGINGLSGTNGANGANGANGPNGANGAKGADGTNGTNGTDGADGVLGPLSSTAGLTALATAAPPTTVVTLTVPAGNYVVFAKTQLSHTGAGDTIDCTLKADTTTIDQGSMKTLPALAAIPISLQAVTTTLPTQLSLQCSVAVANGSANFSSLIAIPVT